MSSFKDFLRWFNNKDVVPTLEAMQKMIAFYHDKDIDMLKLGCTLPNLANICLHKSTDAKFYPFTEADKDLLETIREDVVGGPSTVFTRKAVVYETFIRKSTNICKSFVRIDASQLYPYSMCQPMPIGLYTRWDIDSETSGFTPRQNKTLALKIWSCLIFNVQDLIVKLRASKLQADRRKLIASVLMSFVLIEILCLKQWVAGCFYHFCPCQELRPSLTEEDIKRGSRRRELDELRRSYIQEKGFTIIEMRECE